jgi:hypothetical protein
MVLAKSKKDLPQLPAKKSDTKAAKEDEEKVYKNYAFVYMRTTSRCCINFYRELLKAKITDKHKKEKKLPIDLCEQIIEELVPGLLALQPNRKYFLECMQQFCLMNDSPTNKQIEDYPKPIPEEDVTIKNRKTGITTTEKMTPMKQMRVHYSIRAVDMSLEYDPITQLFIVFCYHETCTKYFSKQLNSGKKVN